MRVCATGVLPVNARARDIVAQEERYFGSVVNTR